MGAAGCAHCEKFRQAGLERCPKCGIPFAAEAARLVLRDAATGQMWELGEGRFVIGRQDGLAQVSLEPGDTPVMLDDRLVSRRHAVIQGAGSVFCVTDAESRDGTQVNEREIAETTAIQEGDRLRFGDTVLVASFGRSAASLTPQAADAERTISQAPAPVEPPARRPPPTSPTAEPMPPVSRPMPRSAEPMPRPSRPSGRGPDTVGPAPKATAAGPKTLMNSAANPQAAPPQRDFDLELSIVLDMFERSGGRQGLKTVLAHARRVEATPDGVDELQTLLAWLPTACRMLETELMLIDLLSARASVAPR